MFAVCPVDPLIEKVPTTDNGGIRGHAVVDIPLKSNLMMLAPYSSPSEPQLLCMTQNFDPSPGTIVEARPLVLQLGLMPREPTTSPIPVPSPKFESPARSFALSRMTLVDPFRTPTKSGAPDNETDRCPLLRSRPVMDAGVPTVAVDLEIFATSVSLPPDPARTNESLSKLVIDERNFAGIVVVMTAPPLYAEARVGAGPEMSNPTKLARSLAEGAVVGLVTTNS